ncbi:uroporphyrinogen-III synthase [Aneurinibacillus sp. Ricciae_BoGa-3]|uniref:uroporphyrinogen-III synthase n=1 Tax=Aneurinibacillus sp. Ricciae_BoGa-3 TaxID=3022697 RepID=UPI0023401CFE|nr:uroporphyrinogen-III synthase [Aneurinibacillus sp. Ricciae_BoGa-3]WCK53667.1 uroporphyrinogen-III synthase [Aneurinibacillus sp. Ricciae_BoGa-3]
MTVAKEPLSGKRIVVTRSSGQARDMQTLIERLGGTAVMCPVMKIVPPKDQAAFDASLARLASFDWIIFTSANGVRFFFQRAEQLGIEAFDTACRAKVAAVGSKTAEALAAQGMPARFVADTFTAEGLIEILKDKVAQGEKALLPRANIARKTLPLALAALGLDVTDAPAYDTVAAEENFLETKELLRQRLIDIITFASSSAVRFFLAGLGEDNRSLLEGVKIAVIGPVTARTAHEQGLHVDIEAEEYTISGLVDAIVRHS